MGSSQSSKKNKPLAVAPESPPKESSRPTSPASADGSRRKGSFRLTQTAPSPEKEENNEFEDDGNGVRKPELVSMGSFRDSALVKQLSGTLQRENSYTRRMINTDDNIKDVVTLKQPSFDFKYTEGKNRREMMNDCENECSEIFSYLYLGGAKIAQSWETLSSLGITRVVNCARSVVDNCFANRSGMRYLSIDMLDGRQDDVTWFVCNVIQFIFKGKLKGEKTLIHCEKGVSRSCSFAIAYHMWAMGTAWKVSFDYVKSKRSVCNPNTAFTCNLIEFGELIVDDNRANCVTMRCSHHLPHDPNTPVLKICRYGDSRKIIPLSSIYFDSDGVYVVRPGDNYKQSKLYVWMGKNSNQDICDIAITLAKNTFGVFTRLSDTLIVKEGAEPAEWKELFKHYNDSCDENQALMKFDDLYKKTSNKPIIAPTNDDDLQENQPQFALLSDDKTKFNAPKKIPLTIPVSTIVIAEESSTAIVTETTDIDAEDNFNAPDQAMNVVMEYQPPVIEVEPNDTPDSPDPVTRSTKPVLYHAIPSGDSGNFKWESLGVFDDDDLVENTILLLHCADNTHYVWIGSEFNITGTNTNVDIESSAEVAQWVKEYIELGELNDSQFVTSTLLLNFSGKESDDFWNTFNLGM